MCCQPVVAIEIAKSRCHLHNIICREVTLALVIKGVGPVLSFGIVGCGAFTRSLPWNASCVIAADNDTFPKSDRTTWSFICPRVAGKVERVDPRSSSKALFALHHDAMPTSTKALTCSTPLCTCESRHTAPPSSGFLPGVVEEVGNTAIQFSLTVTQGIQNV